MSRAPRYLLTSYGCQMNKLDSELVESRLTAAGYERAEGESDADVVLLNTCSVRQHAEDRVWSRLGVLRQLKREKPGLVVGVLGCMAEEHQRYIRARMPHVDLVVGPSAFGDIDEKVETLRARGSDEEPGDGVVAVGHGVSGDTIRRDVRVRPHRSQAYVNVMRGCNMPCSYCIVPATRGQEISRPIADIVEEVERLCDDGVSEVTLLGQTVNAYGRDLGRDVTLARLLRALHEIPALRRIAFITSHPNFLSAELIDALAELPRVSRYLHLPAQSGSNAVLKAMRRGYTAERYRTRVEQLRARAPDIELHSDWIVGYPGETDEDFAATVALMEEIRFAQSYVFKYSPRPGTLAADVVDDVPDAVKAERNRILNEVQERHTVARNQEFVGSVQEILVEGPSKVAGRLTGRTVHHRIVHFDSTDERLAGRYVPVRILEALGHSLLGEQLAEDHAEVGA
ncbi:MAG: tRNA (N6-isopentenyl adenosine(37)-C2)-methylthiotransferase MiaB [Planctomycetota bacterium]|nr:tRNA (N6-isopentenyl adenosine(37)-C2)-methylthiotransferase MiaB [Planctomycetota bacterium]